MINIENTVTPNGKQWERIIMGMRNPLNSWELSDTVYDNTITFDDRFDENYDVTFGVKDMSLMRKLVNAGTDHRKFMRMVVVYADITAPLYWWKEFDTYKVGTVANSTSTMHKIASRQFTLNDFSYDHLNARNISRLQAQILALNEDRLTYLESKDKEDWWQLIQMLPTSYNQKRTVLMNYEVLANIYKSRKNHKLDEWIDFCKWVETLPMSELITGKGLSSL